MDPNTEIRKLRPAEFYTIARILAVSDSWRVLMAVVPKEETDNPKFNTEHIALIEEASFRQRRSGAEIFLEEWSTMGRKRPTLSATLELLIKAQLFRAADYIAVELLRRQPPERPADGPAAKIEISDEEIAKLMNHAASESDIPDSQFSKESLESVRDGRGSSSTYSEVQSSELPQFVLEIAHQKSTRSGSTADSTPANVSSNVNSRSETLEYNELASAELPQFVADLGHRKE